MRFAQNFNYFLDEDPERTGALERLPACGRCRGSPEAPAVVLPAAQIKA